MLLRQRVHGRHARRGRGPRRQRLLLLAVLVFPALPHRQPRRCHRSRNRRRHYLRDGRGPLGLPPPPPTTPAHGLPLPPPRPRSRRRHGRRGRDGRHRRRLGRNRPELEHDPPHLPRRPRLLPARGGAVPGRDTTPSLPLHPQPTPQPIRAATPSKPPKQAPLPPATSSALARSHWEKTRPPPGRRRPEGRVGEEWAALIPRRVGGGTRVAPRTCRAP
ncbi:hypothetical protein SEVIR_3G089201v4 [Setaria viridis]